MTETEREPQFTNEERIAHLEEDLKVAVNALKAVARVNPAIIAGSQGPNSNRVLPIIQALRNAQEQANKGLDAIFENQYLRESVTHASN